MITEPKTKTQNKEEIDVHESGREMIIDMAQELLRRCDGAQSRDGMGYNKYDAQFVRDVLSNGRDKLSDKQVEALKKSLYKYKGQLESIGFDESQIDQLKEKKEKDEDESENVKSDESTTQDTETPNADVIFEDVHQNKYGMKVFVDTPYDAKKDVWDNLRWEKTHHTWNSERKQWSVDLEAVPYLVEQFESKGYSVHINNDVKAEYSEQTGFQLESESVELRLTKIEGARLEVYDDGNKKSIRRSGVYTVDKGSQIAVVTKAGGTKQVKVHYTTGEIDETVKITVNDKYAKVNPSDVTDEIDKIFDKELSYFVQGYKHVSSYKKGKWDGREKLYNKKHHSAPSGLAYRMKETLEENDYEVELQDRRDAPQPTENFSWNFPYDLREYQIEAIEQSLQRNGIVNLPTGAGKTVCGLRMVYELQKRTLVLVHKTDLLYQWKEEVQAILGLDDSQIGIIGDNKWSEGRVTIAMLQTLSSRGVEDLDNYDVLICDETHHVPADTFFKVVSDIPAFHKYGLTATAYRTDNAEMKIFAGVGDITAQITAEELIEDGFLSEPDFEVIEWKRDYKNDADYHTQRQQMRDSENRNDAIVKRAQELKDKGYKVLIDVYRVNHGQDLADRLDTDFVYGNTESEIREKMVDAFKDADGGKVIVSTLLDEGVDIPSMNAIILADMGKSSIKAVQTIGRALRPKNGSEAKVIDVDDRRAGEHMRNHFYNRQESMKNYYGKYYNKDW